MREAVQGLERQGRVHEISGREGRIAARYDFNDVVRYARTSKETGMERGEYAQVKSVDADKNLLTVGRADGSELTYDPRQQQGVSVYREEPRSFAVGDRIQFAAPANDLKIANRELGTVEAIGQDGQMRLKMDGGRDGQLDFLGRGTLRPRSTSPSRRSGCCLGFRNAYVFDISQTNGVELPEMERVVGDPGENIERLTAFLDGKRIAVSYSENIAPALGMSYGGRIVLLPGQSKAETFSTLVHEAGHQLLDRSERRASTTKTVRETEAEAVAFVVGKAVGLVHGSDSAN